jgi:hypothetical protein
MSNLHFRLHQNHHYLTIRFYNNSRLLLFYISQTYSYYFSPTKTNIFYVFCESIFGVLYGMSNLHFRVHQNMHFSTIRFYNNSRALLFYISQTYSFPFSPVETNIFYVFCESIFGYMPLTVWSSRPSFCGMSKSPFFNY